MRNGDPRAVGTPDEPGRSRPGIPYVRKLRRTYRRSYHRMTREAGAVTNPERATAVHEAGHAAAAYVLGRPFLTEGLQ